MREIIRGFQEAAMRKCIDSRNDLAESRAVYCSEIVSFVICFTSGRPAGRVRSRISRISKVPIACVKIDAFQLINLHTLQFGFSCQSF